MKIALLFPGQGSQYPGMGKSLYDHFPECRKIFDEANAVLGYDIKSKIFQGSEVELKQTVLTQPAIYVVSCAAFQLISKIVPEVAFLAGHSLGEYSALFAAEVFDFQTGLKLVEYRGQCIQECCEKYPGAMAAVLGADKNKLEELCRKIQIEKGCCQMVNFNSPGQIVVAGAREAIAELVRRISDLPGSKAISLNVSGAFHSDLMQEAAAKMTRRLETVPLQGAKIPAVTNYDAEITTAAGEIKKKLAAQIDHPVLWEESVGKMIVGGAETFVEVGPGKALSGILRKIDKSKRSLNIEDQPSHQRLLNELNVLAA